MFRCRFCLEALDTTDKYYAKSHEAWFADFEGLLCPFNGGSMYSGDTYSDDIDTRRNIDDDSWFSNGYEPFPAIRTW